MASKFSLLALIPLSAINGCYRAVTLSPSEVSEARFVEQSAHILYRNGDTRAIDRFDTLTVRDRSRDYRTGTHEYGRDVSGELQGFTLRLQDDGGEDTFDLENVRYMDLEKYDPVRPWIIIGVATAATTFGAFAGWNVAGCSPEGHCLGALLGSVVGGAVGLGLGVGITVPLTYPLGTRTPADAQAE